MNTLLLIYAAIFGLVIGSFLNCLVWRLHDGASLLGRSVCRACRALVRWFDNIPLLSFLMLKGRCRNCRAPISWQYFIVEAVTAILFAAAMGRVLMTFGAFETWTLEAWLTLARDLIFLSALIVTFVTDIRWYEIFDVVVLPAAVVVGALNLAIGASWLNLLVSATIGGGFFLFQYVVSRGRWIGNGDSRLGLLLGLGLSWPLIVPAIFIAYLLGAATGISLMGIGKKVWTSKLPLGTFLAAAAVISLFYGEAIVNWYLSFIHL